MASDVITLFLYGKTRTGGFHPNGGGFVEETATVDIHNYVGPIAKVLDKAVVWLGQRIEGQVIVCGNAVIGQETDAQHIDAAAVQQGQFLVKICDHSIVRDDAKVYNELQDKTVPVLVKGYSIVKDQAVLKNGYIVSQTLQTDPTVIPKDGVLNDNSVLRSNAVFPLGIDFPKQLKNYDSKPCDKGCDAP